MSGAEVFVESSCQSTRVGGGLIIGWRESVARRSLTTADIHVGKSKMPRLTNSPTPTRALNTRRFRFRIRIPHSCVRAGLGCRGGPCRQRALLSAADSVGGRPSEATTADAARCKRFRICSVSAYACLCACVCLPCLCARTCPRPCACGVAADLVAADAPTRTPVSVWDWAVEADPPVGGGPPLHRARALSPRPILTVVVVGEPSQPTRPSPLLQYA